MARKIVIDNSSGEVRAAVIEDGRLADLFIERSRHPSVLGNIYKGKVENVLPGMQAAFVDVGLEKNAFLYVDDALASLPEIIKSTKNGDEVELPKSRGKSIRELLKPGQEVLVQVTKEAIGTKGARVVTDVTLAGRYVVLIPSVNYVGVSRKIVDDEVRDRLRKLANKAKPRGMGLIVRTVAEDQTDEEIVRDIDFLTRAWRKIRGKAAKAKAPHLLHYDADLVYRMARDYFGDDVSEFTVNTVADYSKVSDLLHIDEKEKDPRIRLYSDKKPVFEAYGIEEEIWKATRRKVWLSSGGYLIFDTTEALTVVDVNTGKFTGSKDLEDTAFRNNLEAAQEIARQLRLRNIGGIIIADFIDMESEEHRKKVLENLEKHLSRDKARTSVLGITKLGLIEMTRKKSQQGLVELTHRVCDVCEGRGKVISEETLALRAERLIKREAATTDMQALLIGLNPYVAEELSQEGFAAIKELELQTSRDIFIKSDTNLAREDVKVIAAGSLEEMLAIVSPVKKGEAFEVTIGQPNQERPEYGIGIHKGMPVHVEDAGNLVGQAVKVKVVRLFKGYAKARIEGRQAPIRRVLEHESEDEADELLLSKELEMGAVEAADDIDEAGEPATEGQTLQETKKKRRRRRHRRGNKDKESIAPATEASPTAEDMAVELGDVAEVPSEATEYEAEGEADEATPVEAIKDGQLTAEVKKKRRRRRRRSKRPSQAALGPETAALPSGEAQDSSASVSVAEGATAKHDEHAKPLMKTQTASLGAQAPKAEAVVEEIKTNLKPTAVRKRPAGPQKAANNANDEPHASDEPIATPYTATVAFEGSDKQEEMKPERPAVKRTRRSKQGEAADRADAQSIAETSAAATVQEPTGQPGEIKPKKQPRRRKAETEPKPEIDTSSL